jgi:phenylpropionate dioxygenase-like ring-hydroxylating dioxygenase large terminal subunit
MGRFMRQFWTPATLSRALVADGPPKALRLLGQNFVAFRASDGRVCMLDEGCPHRGASLALAHNSDCALQCLYHGWKIDVSGKVVDVPTEPAHRRAEFASRVNVRRYPLHEAAGIVWAWLADGEAAPFPCLNWTDVPTDHVYTSLNVIRASWVFGFEGQLDGAHVGILHQDWTSPIPGEVKNSELRLEFEDQPYGYREAVLRNLPDGTTLARVKECVMPWYVYIPSEGGREATQLLTISVPIDDDTSAQWFVYYNLQHPIEFEKFPPMTSERDYTHLATDAQYGQDRTLFAAGKWSGYPSLPLEDFAVATAQHAAADRERENLSHTDQSIVYARRMLCDAARRYANGESLACLSDGVAWESIRAFAEPVPAGTDWRDLTRG